MFEESIATAPSIWSSMNSWLTPTVLFVLLNLMIGTIAITSSLATHKPTSQEQEEKQVRQAYHGHHQQLPRSPSILQRFKSINFYSHRSHEPTTITFEKPQEFDTHFFHHQTPQQQDFSSNYYQNQQPTISRSPSMLQRLKSINLYNYLSPQEPISSKPQEPQQAHYSPQQIDLSIQEKDQKEEETEDEEEENEQIQDQELTLDEIYSKLKGTNNKVVNRSNSDTKPSAGEVPPKLSKKMKKSASSKSAFAHFKEEDIVESRRPATVRESASGQKGKLTDVDDAEVDAKADDFINKFKQQLKLQRLDSIMRYKDMISRGSGK